MRIYTYYSRICIYFYIYFYKKILESIYNMFNLFKYNNIINSLSKFYMFYVDPRNKQKNNAYFINDYINSFLR